MNEKEIHNPFCYLPKDFMIHILNASSVKICRDLIHNFGSIYSNLRILSKYLTWNVCLSSWYHNKWFSIQLGHRNKYKQIIHTGTN